MLSFEIETVLFFKERLLLVLSVNKNWKVFNHRKKCILKYYVWWDDYDR